LIYCNTKQKASEFELNLKEKGFPVAGLYDSTERIKKDKIFQELRCGSMRILITNVNLANIYDLHQI
jgi:superfamily II DNA/RNA helicase